MTHHERQLTLIVSGVVQGIYFRQFVAERASSFRIAGYAQNQLDGTVKIVVEGPEDTLEAFIPIIMRGPAGAHVKDIEAEWKAASGIFKGFEIK